MAGRKGAAARPPRDRSKDKPRDRARAAESLLEIYETRETRTRMMLVAWRAVVRALVDDDRYSKLDAKIIEDAYRALPASVEESKIDDIPW